MSTVRQTQPTIQLLLSGNEYAGALDLITTTQDVLYNELAGIQCFRFVSQTIMMTSSTSRVLVDILAVS